MSETPPETPYQNPYLAPETPEKPIETEEIPPEKPEDSVIDEGIQRQIAERREQKKAETVAKFEKLDTKVQIGDIGRNFDRTRSPRVRNLPAAKEGTRDAKVKERTDQWTHWIIEDANPLLLKSTQTWCGIPEMWLDNKILSAIDPKTNKAIVFWDPPLRTRLELSEKKAKTLAKAAAEFSVSPMGVAIVAWVETHQFMISVGMAMWVAAQYGWVLMQTKAEVAQVKAIVEQQRMAAMQQQAMQEGYTGGNGATRYPGFGETTADYDAEQNS